MSSISFAVSQLPNPERAIGKLLIDYYEAMKALERDPERGGKQATLIVMTMNDMLEIAQKHELLAGSPH